MARLEFGPDNLHDEIGAAMVKQPTLPSELELLILKVLWQAESDGTSPLPVREIRDLLAERGRDLAHTSVISTLNVMLEKKFVKRKSRKNAFLFAARVSAEMVHRNEIGKVLDRVFDGSAENLMSALLKTDKLDSAAITEIKRMIDKSIRESGS
jgi:BlaI family transcriptional regulator, penicillinase repressor